VSTEAAEARGSEDPVPQQIAASGIDQQIGADTLEGGNCRRIIEIGNLYHRSIGIDGMNCIQWNVGSGRSSRAEDDRRRRVAVCGQIPHQVDAE
jgi:hypothetical protein